MSTTGTTSPLRRLVLLGSDEIALPAFRAAAALPGVSIVAVYSQPDRPSGRGQEIQPNAVTAWARAEGYLVRQPERLGPEHAAELGADQVDLGVVMAYGQILKDDLLASTRLGFVNFHGSILPALRGATPVEAALASAWSSTGVSLQQVVRRLDAGPLHAQASLSVPPGEGRSALRARLGRLAGQLAEQALPTVLRGLPCRCRRMRPRSRSPAGLTDRTRPSISVLRLRPWPPASARSKVGRVRRSIIVR